MARTLLDDPVLYLRDLSDEARAYLQRQGGYLLRQIREASGLMPEARREGIAMVDNAGDLTDLKLPEEGTDGHLSLLLAAWFAEQLKRNPGAIIPFLSIEEQVRNLIRMHGSKWRKAAKEPGAESGLSEETLLRLRWLRLIQITPDGILPLAAVGRYATAPADDTKKQE
jgi:uncharacterized protein (TIGR02678 family)